MEERQTMGDQKPENGQSERTILESDQVAVTFDLENGFQIMMPDYDGEEDLPEGALALIAVGMRLTDDPVFYQELVSWMKSRLDQVQT